MTHLYYMDGYHGGIRGHMPLGCWRDILDQLNLHPEWRLSIDAEPISWDYLKARDPGAYAEISAFPGGVGSAEDCTAKIRSRASIRPAEHKKMRKPAVFRSASFSHNGRYRRVLRPYPAEIGTEKPERRRVSPARPDCP